MNNQGLDALAALAAAASHSAYPVSSSTNSTTTNTGAGTSEETSSDNNKSSTSNNNTPALPVNAAAQQWQQAIANAAAGLNVLSGASGSSPNNLALLGLQHQLNHGSAAPTTTAATSNPNLYSIQQQLAMQQQLNYFQMLAHAAANQQQQRHFASTSNQVTPGSAAGMQSLFPNVNGTSPVVSTAGVGFSSPANLLQTVSTNNVLPLLNATQATGTLPHAPVGFPAAMPQPTIVPSLTAIAPQPLATRTSVAAPDWSDDDNADETEYYNGDKRQLKRVANRKSAQLSRKRKKQFIEELKEENDGLRRKEQILRSIPDLVVVFDSSGKLWFVSESVSRFLDFTADELEGTSFWNRLCDDSVRLLKAAFMDSLAARQPDAETASLGSGTWELRLVDKDDSHKVVTLHGVVHFAGDRPECVCSIRPADKATTTSIRNDNSMRHEAFVSASASSNGSCTSSVKRHRKTVVSHVKPNQSVVTSSETANSERQHLSDASSLRGSTNRNGAVRISDSGMSSGSSDSGSGDEMNANEVAA